MVTGMQLSWFFDILVVALALIFLYIGGKRGFIGTVTLIVGYIASFVVAFILSTSVSPILYDNVFKAGIISKIEASVANIDIVENIQSAVNREDLGITFGKEEISSAIQNSTGDLGNEINAIISEKTGGADVGITKEDIDIKIKETLNSSMVQNIIDKLPAALRETANEFLNSSTENITNSVKQLSKTPKEAAEFIEESFIRESVISLIKVISFLLALALLMIIVRVLAKVFAQVHKLPLIGSADSVLGGILGITEGLAVVFIISIVIHLLIGVTNNEMIVLNTQTIDQTVLFKMFYNINILG
ncbi:MAG: CvpA family protein [Oscillospiraceae bacterium]